MSAKGLAGAIESAERPAQEAKQELIRSSEEQQAKGAAGLIAWDGDPSEIINTGEEKAVEK